MSDLWISEAASVQFPIVAHAAEIGWTATPPEGAVAKRGGEAGMLFRDELGAKLATFNPWMSTDAIRQVVERMEALPPTVEGNREMLIWLRGERQWYDDGEKRHRCVRIVDFDTPRANALHVTWEWTLKPPARKGNRADVMFIVNGAPVAVVEHKNRDAIERGVTQLRRYEVETPELVAAPQLFNVTHLITRRAASGPNRNATTSSTNSRSRAKASSTLALSRAASAAASLAAATALLKVSANGVMAGSPSNALLTSG